MRKMYPVAVSIIVPYYNVLPKYFDKCFESIVSQTMEDFEVLVIDDGSNEDIKSYLESKIREDERFRLIRQNNCGVSIARNRGLKEAIGKAVCFIDADDYVASWMIEDLWKAYSTSNVQAVVGYYDLATNDDYIFTRGQEKVSIIKSDRLQDIAIIGMNCNATNYGYLSAGPVSVLFNTEIAREISFPESIKYMEDVIWNLHYFKQCKDVAIYEGCLYAYRQNANSATHNYSLNVIEERKKALNIIRTLAEDNQWYPLRLFTNYTVCCRCIMKTVELTTFREKIKCVRILYKDPIWDGFKKSGVTRNWDMKFRVKYQLVKIGLLPYIYGVK